MKKRSEWQVRLPELYRGDLRKVFTSLGQYCNIAAANKGFWDVERNKAEMIALMHEELSEMLGGVRKPGPSDKIPEFTQEEEEMADLLIRAFDYIEGHNLRIVDAMLAKFEYNANRPHLHGKKF